MDSFIIVPGYTCILDISPPKISKIYNSTVSSPKGTLIDVTIKMILALKCKIPTRHLTCYKLNFKLNSLKTFQEDRANGLIPFILIITVGTTNTCAVESIRELGSICEREGIWVHVDAAYAGNKFLI